MLDIKGGLWNPFQRGGHMLVLGCDNTLEDVGMWGIKTRGWQGWGFHQTGDSNPVLRRWVRTGWSSILGDSCKDGHWNKKLVDFGYGFMVNPVILNYDFLKLVSPFPCPQGWHCRWNSRSFLTAVKEWLQEQETRKVVILQQNDKEIKGTVSLNWPDKRNFPGSLVDRTQCFHYRGHRFYPWWEI